MKSDQILERMMSLHPKIIDLTLTRMHRLLAALDHPEKQLPPVIHIAGTNGKGSTQAMIRAGLESTDAKVHAYTSPHLVRFHERIRLAGEIISEDSLQEILDECLSKNGDTQITYFEITTCAALLAFARTEADFTLLEVGLGGVFDATNVVDTPRLCVITPISIDHQDFLGDTIEEIAAEKAGILKKGVYCIVGPQQDAAMAVIEEKAAEVGAALLKYGQDWQVWEENGRLVFQDQNGLLDLPLPVLQGAHQIENAGAAVAALRALGNNDAVCEAAVENVEWPARMQKLRTGTLITAADQAEIWLDGGHNTAAGASIAEFLGRLGGRNTHVICGMLKTKDAAGYMHHLKPHTMALYGVSIPDQPATLTAVETVKAAKSVGIPAKVAESVEDAVNLIAAQDPEARILICGSLYLAGVVLRDNG